MESEIALFEHLIFGRLRVLERNGEPWFSTKDACDGLGINNPRQATARLEKDEVITTVISNDGAASGKSSMSFVSFPGLLSLILGSRKPEAREYKRWVTHEVLPSIHKHGGYIAGQERMDDAELMARALQVSQKIIESKDALISRLEPKALVGEALTKGENDMSIGTLAKYLTQAGFKVGQNTLFGILRRDGYLMRRDGDNVPTQRAMELGVFSMTRRNVELPDGRSLNRTTTRVTPKGVRYFVKRYVHDGKDAA